MIFSVHVQHLGLQKRVGTSVLRRQSGRPIMYLLKAIRV